MSTPPPHPILCSRWEVKGPGREVCGLLTGPGRLAPSSHAQKMPILQGAVGVSPDSPAQRPCWPCLPPSSVSAARLGLCTCPHSPPAPRLPTPLPGSLQLDDRQGSTLLPPFLPGSAWSQGWSPLWPHSPRALCHSAWHHPFHCHLMVCAAPCACLGRLAGAALP